MSQDKDLQDMDKPCADTDLANHDDGDQEGRANPVIPPAGAGEIGEPLAPKSAPAAPEKDASASDALEDQANHDDGPNNQEEARPQRDSFKFADNVIEKIAGIAAREIDGILALKGNFVRDLGELIGGAGDPTRGVSAHIDEKDVAIEIKMIIEYGAPAPQIFAQLRQHIGQQIALMTGLHLAELNVEVVDVMTREEFEQAHQRRYTPFEPDARTHNRYNDPQNQRHGPHNQRPPSGRNF